MASPIERDDSARVFVGRAGPAYRTASHLELRGDHAVRTMPFMPMSISNGDSTVNLFRRMIFFRSKRMPTTKQEYLLRPDLGRVSLNDDAKELLRSRREPRTDLQLVIGDVSRLQPSSVQVPLLLPMLIQFAKSKGWRVGLPFFVRHCRVGVLNDVGEVLRPRSRGVAHRRTPRTRDSGGLLRIHRLFSLDRVIPTHYAI